MVKDKKITFKYLREPTETDQMKSRDAFRYLEYAMISVGWLPPPKTSRYYQLGLYKIVRLLAFGLALYLPIGFVITYSKELSTFTPGGLLTSLQAFFNSPGAFLKGLITYLNAWRLPLLKDSLRKLDERLITIEERLKVHRSVKRCNFFYLCFLVVYAIFGTLTMLAAGCRGQVPWRVYNPVVDWRDGPISLWIALSFELLLGLAALGFQHMNDSFPLIFGLNIRVHIELVQERILNLRTDPSRTEEENYEELKACIKDHMVIEEACNIMRPYLSPIYFLQFLAVGLLFGVTMCNIMFFAETSVAFESAVYAFALVMQTFPFCFVCTLIDSDCDKLALSVFQSNWSGAPRQYSSSLIYFMHNVQKNITFTAGAIFPICLATNISVAKLAFSVVTFVQQMNLAEKLNPK